MHSWGGPTAYVRCPIIDVDSHQCGLQKGHEGDHKFAVPAGYHADDRTTMKAGKLQLELIDLAFVADMALQLQAGLVGDRVPDGWRELDPEVWVRKYRGAVFRHLVGASHHFGAIDSNTGATHWAGVAVNAMICGVLERMAFAQRGNVDTATGADLDAIGKGMGLPRGYRDGRLDADTPYRERLQASRKF